MYFSVLKAETGEESVIKPSPTFSMAGEGTQ